MCHPGIAAVRFLRVFAALGASLLLTSCASEGTGGKSVSGYCAGGRCTGICVDEVKDYARERLGSEATGVYFSFGDDDPSQLSTAVAYFRTEDCAAGEYQVQFFGTSESCGLTYLGRLPKYVGKLLVVPKGCKG